MKSQEIIHPRIIEENLQVCLNEEKSNEGSFHFDIHFMRRKTGMAFVLLDSVRKTSQDHALIFDGFYPHKYTDESLRRNGIGALSIASIISQLRERDLLKPTYRVYYSPKVSMDFREFASRLDVCTEGMLVTQYCQRLFKYCRERGFTLSNPFPTND